MKINDSWEEPSIAWFNDVRARKGHKKTAALNVTSKPCAFFCLFCRTDIRSLILTSERVLSIRLSD